MSDEGSNGRDGVGEVDVNLRLAEVDRIFSILEQLLQGERLDREQTNRLIGLFEEAIANPTGTEPETIAEFVSLVEESLIQPDSLEDANVDGLLSVFEQALDRTGADAERTDDVLSVLESAVRDPAGLDADDVEQFRRGIQQAITSVTDPHNSPLGESAAEESELVPAEDSDLETVRLARLAAAMTQRATGYSLESGVRTGTRMGYAAINATSPAELLTEIRAITLDELQRSGVDIGERRSEWLDAHEDAAPDDRPVTGEQLRQRGERLLSKSAELGRSEAFHPAYPSMLNSLAADEARILRLLATEGKQASIDLYDRQYLPPQSQLVARTLSMVGTDAGCRNTERTPIYLQNLQRLGLIRVTEEPVADLKRYQVLDAQPHIEAAIDRTNRPKTVYGSIQLTELGIDFCEACLPVTVEHEAGREQLRVDERPNEK